MKHIKSICSLLLLAVILMAGNSSFAANLPKMKDKYVTDAAGILSNSELNQLRTDVKSMCDYYSTRILVGIVPTFDGYDIEEYAGMLSEYWNLDDENTMFILVKPKSDNERGEAMLVTSSDLKDVFSSEVCDKIVQNEMIPHFKNNDYFGGIEAVLEYMNNMSDEDNGTNYAAAQSNDDDSYDQGETRSDREKSSEGGSNVIIIVLLVVLFVGAIIAALVIMSKKKNSTSHSTPNNSQNRVSNESYEDPALKAQIEEKKRQLEAKKRQEKELRELERLNQEMDQQNSYADDYSDNYEESESRGLGNAMGVVNSLGGVIGAGAAGGGLLNSIGSAAGSLAGKGELVKKAAIGAAVVGGTVLVLKNKDKIAGSVKSMFGGAKAVLSNSSSNDSSSKPRLGGNGNSSKPTLGGSNKPSLGGGGNKPKLGGGGKPKLGGGSSSGGW
jgi:uncharacterized membrane protein YgcG